MRIEIILAEGSVLKEKLQKLSVKNEVSISYSCKKIINDYFGLPTSPTKKKRSPTKRFIKSNSPQKKNAQDAFSTLTKDSFNY